jgi:hypothetical protein
VRITAHTSYYTRTERISFTEGGKKRKTGCPLGQPVRVLRGAVRFDSRTRKIRKGEENKNSHRNSMAVFISRKRE